MSLRSAARSRRNARRALAAVALAGMLPAARAQAAERPELYVLENVRRAPGAELEKLVLEEGRIREILPAEAENPPGARVADGQGGVVLPAWIDAYTRAGIETPEPVADRDRFAPTDSDVQVDMRAANRRGVQPAFRAVDSLSGDDKHSKAAREQGFGAVCIAPAGHLLPGSSTVLTTRAAAPRDTVLVPVAFDHAELRSSDGGYPSTLMGCMAQLRQFFLDARRQRELALRSSAGRPGPRPPYDRDLEALEAVLGGERRLVCHAETHRDVERWIALSEELGFEIAFTGSREAWRVSEELAERRIPVALTLDWGEEVDDPAKPKEAKKKRKPAEEQDPPPEGQAASGEEEEESGEPSMARDEERRWEYLEPIEVRAERRRLWEETRDCALRLHEADVPFALASGGATQKELLKRARELVEAGLPADAAVAAMTANAAAFLGLADRLGGLEPGMLASLAVWSGAPTAKGSKLLWLFVEGYPHEFDAEDEPHGAPDEGVDAGGRWTIEQEDVEASTLELEMTPEGEVSGTLKRSTPEGEIEAEVSGWVSGTTLSIEGSFQMGDMEVTFSMEGELEGDEWSGSSNAKGPWGELERPFTGRRDPQSKPPPEDDGERGGR
jgi:imidazolonepropionase-like amidohydrolase